MKREKEDKMENRLEVADQMSKIDDKIQELKAEKCSLIGKELTYLKTRINTILTKFNKRYDPAIEKVLVMGRMELALLYDSYEFLNVSELGLELNDNGLINKIWGMTIYTKDITSILEVFGKADSLIFVEEKLNIGEGHGVDQQIQARCDSN